MICAAPLDRLDFSLIFRFWVFAEHFHPFSKTLVFTGSTF